MTSGRQRRAQIKQERAGKKAAIAAAEKRERVRQAEMLRQRRPKGQIAVNAERLSPNRSYSTPDFVERGLYVDRSFQCKDCGLSEVWTAHQQKWWYETAKGDVWTVAIRCRSCRRRERDRKAAARQTHFEGLAKKRKA